MAGSHTDVNLADNPNDWRIPLIVGIIIIVVASIACTAVILDSEPPPPHVYLIVQYSQDGQVINSWETTGVIFQEPSGISFPTSQGFVQVGGNYVCVRNPADDMRAQYLRRKP